MAELTDVEASVKEPEGIITVSLGDQKIRVLPPEEWETAAFTALRTGDFEAWAEGALTDESYEVWMKYRPKIREARDAVEEWTEESGAASNLNRSQRRRMQSARSQKR